MRLSHLGETAGLLGLGMAMGLAMAYLGSMALWSALTIGLAATALWGAHRRDHVGAAAGSLEWSEERER